MAFGIIGWIVIGGLAGWIASKFMGRDAQMGIVLNIIVGILGAILGGWLLGMFMDTKDMGLIMSFVTALVGSCVLLLIINLLTRKRAR